MFLLILIADSNNTNEEIDIPRAQFNFCKKSKLSKI